MAKTQRISHDPKAKAAAKFANNLQLVAKDSDNFFDSVNAATDAISESITGQNTLGIPEGFAALLDEVGDSAKAPVVAAFLDSIADYEAQHGQAPSPDLLQHVINAAYQQTRQGIKDAYRTAGFILDDASELLPESGAMQANRAIVSITTALAAAIPWANNIPTDIGSGEAKLIIVNHNAVNHFGGYEAGGNLDGINSGRSYMTSSRFDKCTIAGGAGAGTFALTSVQTDNENCAAVAGDVVAVKLVPGTAVVYVNGHQVATEVKTSTATSNFSGSVTLSSTLYAISGTINTDTGAGTIASSPALPNDTELLIEGIIDYNRQSAIIPAVGLDSQVYSLFANPWRASALVGIDARTQFNNEAGLDPMSQLMAALQRQLMNEKHYKALDYGRRLAIQNQATYDVSVWLATGAQTRAQSIENITIPLGMVSQQMAVDTNSYGVSHVYCGAKMKAWLLLSQSGRFVPSGIRDYPGIHRIGTLDNTYEFYYSPRISETTDGSGITTAELLCVGMAQDVARSPVVMGQAVSPLLLPAGRTLSLEEGVGYFEKAFIKPNPHTPSAKGFALITVSGLK